MTDGLHQAWTFRVEGFSLLRNCSIWEIPNGRAGTGFNIGSFSCCAEHIITVLLNQNELCHKKKSSGILSGNYLWLPSLLRNANEGEGARERTGHVKKGQMYHFQGWNLLVWHSAAVLHSAEQMRNWWLSSPPPLVFGTSDITRSWQRWPRTAIPQGMVLVWWRPCMATTASSPHLRYLFCGWDNIGISVWDEVLMAAQGVLYPTPLFLGV